MTLKYIVIGPEQLQLAVSLIRNFYIFSQRSYIYLVHATLSTIKHYLKYKM